MLTCISNLDPKQRVPTRNIRGCMIIDLSCCNDVREFRIDNALKCAGSVFIQVIKVGLCL